MARSKAILVNIDKSNPSEYLEGRIKDNSGAGDGTPINEYLYGDLHQNLAKLMSLYNIKYNQLPDNETNGYQLIEALIGLASKNDFVLALTSSNGVLSIPIKLASLKTNESFICKSVIDFDAETTVKGSLDNSNKAAIFTGEFKNGEYVRVINHADNVEFIRLVDSANLDVVTAFFKYLKATSQAVENTGTSEAVATTPKSNKSIFTKRVIGTDSLNFLATAARNGLLSKEDKAILNNLGADRIRNVGYFAGLEIRGGQLDSTYPVGGNIIAAKKTQSLGFGDVIEVTFSNSMDSTDYKLDISVESQGDFTHDNDFKPVVWKPKSATQAYIYIEETDSGSQNIKIHIDVIQL
jgi:hypothetical protein